MYFNNLPELLYPFSFKTNERDINVIVRDITVNVRVIKEILENITLYDEYDIVDGETPEIISAKLYGTSEYHWVIMLINERFDYLNDFPLPYDRLTQYVKDKYGESNIYHTHHWENTDGYVVNSDSPMAINVTNFEYEELVNESKRRIKLVSKQVIQQILTEFQGLLR